MKKKSLSRYIAILFVLSSSGCSLLQSKNPDTSPPPPRIYTRPVLNVQKDLSQIGPPKHLAIPTREQTVAEKSLPNSAPSLSLTRESAQPVAQAASPNLASPPVMWVTQPEYDFPWILDALPTRVNEETTFGSGSRMLGRLYAQVSFSEDASPATTETKEKKTTRKKKNTEAKFEATKRASQIHCYAVTCLDVARDLLTNDAQDKGWQMLLSKRVSLNQSYQFYREDRLINIELISDGNKTLNIEYNLMPLQTDGVKVKK